MGLEILGFGESWGLVCGFGLGLRGIGPALAGKLGGGWGFRAARWRRFDRFLCLLRPEPAAAGCHGVSQGFALGWFDFGG